MTTRAKGSAITTCLRASTIQPQHSHSSAVEPIPPIPDPSASCSSLPNRLSPIDACRSIAPQQLFLTACNYIGRERATAIGRQEDAGDNRDQCDEEELLELLEKFKQRTSTNYTPGVGCLNTNHQTTPTATFAKPEIRFSLGNQRKSSGAVESEFWILLSRKLGSQSKLEL